jgi:pyruvate formate lyase activating enzyme
MTMERSRSVETRGCIFDLERFATKDGPGIRTVVFFKGCALRCRWCQNPESQLGRPEVIYDDSRCRGCRRCLESCPSGAIRFDERLGLITDRRTCRGCGICAERCFSDARRLAGKEVALTELLAEINKDRSFFQYSGGGVTFSGGEPLLQDAFLLAACRECRKAGIHTALETSGHAPWESLERLVPFLDLIFFDFKHPDSWAHRQNTGVGNRRILKNLRMLNARRAPLVVRIPVIPGFNDSPAVLTRMFRFLTGLPHEAPVELLPFHRLGMSKYRGLGRAYGMEEVLPLRNEDLGELARLGEHMGLAVHVGPV